MKRATTRSLPFAVSATLRKLGADIRIARVKRGLTSDGMAARLGVHRSTYGRLESGDPMVALGTYANALFELGFGTLLGEIADPRRDELGLLLDLERLPKRVRAPRQHRPSTAVLRIRRSGDADADTVKIGVVGAMSGPYALWGLVSKHAAEATADMYNAAGGVDISGRKYRIAIVAIDDELDPRRTVAATEQLTAREGIRYIIGPNVEQTIASAMPVAEKSASMLFPYSFTRSYYLPPHENAVLGQVAGYQAWPVIFGHIREHEGARTVSVLAPHTREGLMQRREAVSAAAEIGLKVLSSERTYRPGAGDLFRAVSEVVRERPDVLVLSNLAPGDAPTLIRLARECGFTGLFATEAAQDIAVLNAGAGEAANGLFALGGASPPALRTAYMDAFMEHYRRRAGAWHDEAGTKAYALELILGTLRMAGRRALDDIGLFKRVIPSFAMANPFVKGEPALQYVGTSYFRQKRQIGVPLVVNAVRDGRFDPLFVGTVD